MQIKAPLSLVFRVELVLSGSIKGEEASVVTWYAVPFFVIVIVARNFLLLFAHEHGDKFIQAVMPQDARTPVIIAQLVD